MHQTQVAISTDKASITKRVEDTTADTQLLITKAPVVVIDDDITALLPMKKKAATKAAIFLKKTPFQTI